MQAPSERTTTFVEGCSVIGSVQVQERFLLLVVRSYKMDKVTFFVDEIDGSEHAIIDRGNGEFTSMLKSTYDAQQAASTLVTESAPTA